jgi:Transposase DNA-binding/Transposase Tn5 dimerisation domain
MMPASTLVSPHQWAEATFGAVELGDPRRRLRALMIAEALATDPGASLPKQLHRAADLEATYRFVQSPDVSYDQLIRPHLEATQQQCREQSQVWERSVQALGSPPEDTRWIHVGDRYSDIFSFLWLCRDQQCDFLVRAAQDRCVDLLVEQAQTPVPPRSHHPEHPSPPALHLFEEVRSWSAQASEEIEVDATQKHPARTAHVALSWRPLRLLPPRSQEAKHWHPLVVWVIHVWEPDPPEGVEPLEWVLLSSVPTQTHQQAQERVEWSRARWMVEDYHQGLKTGCQIEQRHMQDYEGLRTLLGLLSPVAVRLMQLRAVARQTPERAAQQVLPTEVVQVVAHLAPQPIETMSAQQCWHTIARYGGYLGRKSDGPPGWKTLWRGWLYVQTLLEGVHLASQLSSEQLNL